MAKRLKLCKSAKETMLFLVSLFQENYVRSPSDSSTCFMNDENKVAETECSCCHSNYFLHRASRCHLSRSDRLCTVATTIRRRAQRLESRQSSIIQSAVSKNHFTKVKLMNLYKSISNENNFDWSSVSSGKYYSCQNCK